MLWGNHCSQSSWRTHGTSHLLSRVHRRATVCRLFPVIPYILSALSPHHKCDSKLPTEAPATESVVNVRSSAMVQDCPGPTYCLPGYIPIPGLACPSLHLGQRSNKKANLVEKISHPAIEALSGHASHNICNLKRCTLPVPLIRGLTTTSFKGRHLLPRGTLSKGYIIYP